MDIFTVQLFFTWISLLTEISEFRMTGGRGKEILKQNMRYVMKEGLSLAFPSLPEASSFPAQRHVLGSSPGGSRVIQRGDGVGKEKTYLFIDIRLD